MSMTWILKCRGSQTFQPAATKITVPETGDPHQRRRRHIMFISTSRDPPLSCLMNLWAILTPPLRNTALACWLVFGNWKPVILLKQNPVTVHHTVLIKYFLLPKRETLQHRSSRKGPEINRIKQQQVNKHVAVQQQFEATEWKTVRW